MRLRNMAGKPSTISGNKSSPAIRVEGLTKSFGEGEQAVTAVEDISFEIKTGQVVGLLGPNGAGKTTTIKSMLRMVVPDDGTVEISGIDVSEHPTRAHDRIGAILEGARNIYWRLTVQENLSFFAGLGGEEPSAVRGRHERLLEHINLEDKADTTVNELSRGMKQKVSLVSTLARDVDVVFMDEPTLGLDVEASIELREELRRLADHEDVTIILTSHDMDVIEAVCDRVLILNNGSIITNESVEELLDLFRVKQYRVTIAAPLGSDLCHEIQRTFEAEILEDDEKSHIDATVTDPDTVYDLLSVIKSYDKSLHDIRSIDPDLEEVFLQAIGEETASAPTNELSGTDAAEEQHAEVSGRGN